MSASVGSGSVNPDSHPPRPWSHVEVPGNPPPRPPPSAFDESPRASDVSRRAAVVSDPRPRPLPTAAPPRPRAVSRTALVSPPPPRPPPRPPAPTTPPRPPVAASGAVLGPRIVPLSWRLLYTQY